MHFYCGLYCLYLVTHVQWIEGIYCRKEEENLSLYHIPIMTVSMPDKIIAIPIESITNITIEDASSIEKK